MRPHAQEPIRRRRRTGRALGTALIAALLAVLPGASGAVADTGGTADAARATLRYTEGGVPHIVARNFTDLGYGYGYAVAKDNICVLADNFLSVGAERSRYHGPDGEPNTTVTSASDNLTSDLHFQRINDSGVVERLAAQPAPKGPRQEMRDIVAGYAEGYNRYLAETGRDHLTDPACRGAAWVKPITTTDVYRLFYGLMNWTGQGTLADGIVGAKPAPGAAPAPADARTADRLKAGLDRTLRADGKGSNGIAIGSDGADGSHSVLLGNPHFPWRGVGLFWQVQLTVPGKLDVSGAGLLGTPFVQKGHNDRIAWTHSLATPRTFGLYEVHLAPGDPTSYLVDGVKEKMTPRTVRVKVKQPDGSVTEVARTLYETRYGPMINRAMGVDLPWTAGTGHALRDANATNLRGLNTWFGFATADSTADIKESLDSTQGAPWINTMATDRAGNAFYADIQVVPHVTDEQAKRCGTALGKELFPRTGLPVLDGSKSSCAWGSDPDSVEPGLFSPKRLPSLTRKDYVLNSNDSPWLANLHAPLTGYPRIVGDVGTPRSLRTRESLATVEETLKGKGFTKESMQRMLFTDRSRMAVLAAADTAGMCAAFPNGKAPSGNGPVDVRQACRALADWDHTFSLKSRGSLLFERFALKLDKVPGGIWNVPFDPADPVGTPKSLKTASPDVQRAFGDAAGELHAAGIPLDAELGDYQYILRGKDRIPLHGAREALGVLNLITPVWDPKGGNVGVRTGSSYIQVVSFTDDPCPNASTLVTTSQSADPTSPHHADQTKLYSSGKWLPGRFCEKDILASPDLKVVELS
ncbi:acyl-homoserine lactone acylase PvdQ [Streptomyces sp. NBRC 110611]|uniref:penicillin acylase family protein n=1 Tax=Streptomyces sp. NBRC 110611 TaxID=1621259 RepID=UPI00085778FE|nr:penicillin acylase family protein [Streptomyces sp. NBRC 110611]GAU68937.1 acyl-homoserine lactone acylase PvdQ [Streptomyces sp. NBRC 110611]